MAEGYYVHTVGSNGVKEIFITAIPTLGTSVQDNAEALFAQIRDTLQAANAFVFQERIFATEEDNQVYAPVFSLGFASDGRRADGLRRIR